MANQQKRGLSPAGEIRMLAFMFIKALRKDLDRRLKDRNTGLNPLGFVVLSIAGHNKKEYTLSELSKEVMLAPATLVPVVQALEENGFLERGSDSSDRRRSPLRLTRQGKNLLKKLSSIHEDDVLAQKLKQVGEKDVGELRRILKKLVGVIVGEKKLKELLESHPFKYTK